MMEGEGMTTILAFVAVLIVVLIAIIIWQFVKKQRSIYTYAYQQRK